jgi:hypothetical protein
MHLLTVDLPSAGEYLDKHLLIEASGRTAKGLSSKASQTQIGQLLNEYKIEQGALAEMVALRQSLPRHRVGPLRRIVERFPDYTPAAMSLLIAMRQAGDFTGPSEPDGNPNSPSIPRRIAQYWNSPDVPRDVAILMSTWLSHHSNSQYRLFDNRAAQAFLRDNFPPVVLTVYNRARDFAQKADIFRLAYLLTYGGYYVDVDDRCLAPLERLVPSGCSLILSQEDYGTIGNNFVGATPGHPVIRRALCGAVEAVNRGDNDLLWLSTGTGLLSRVFAKHMVFSEQQGSTGLSGVVVLDRQELYRVVAPHCRTAYKQTARHWSHAAFSTRSVTDTGLQALPNDAAGYSLKLPNEGPTVLVE